MAESTDKPPFGKIALCLSGGGFRAAAYALGALDLLNRIQLIDDVGCVSTVSGGTFTGVAYALSKADGKKFDGFFDEFKAFLKSANAIDEALGRIYKTPSPSGSNDISLIRAAADYYHDALFKNRAFGELQKLVRDKRAFGDLIFNATEFRGGNGFRFRASDNKFAFIGNGVFSVPNEIAGELRLADVVAASSCFPGGFEPIRFPDDFHWKSSLSTVRGELVKDVFNPAADPKVYANGFKDPKQPDQCIPLPLMDGGIFDNQGVAATVMADTNGKKYGLYLITDTSQREDAFYVVPDTTKKSRGLKLKHWLIAGAVSATLCILSVIATLMLAIYPSWVDGLTTLGRGALFLIALPPILILVVGALKLLALFREYKVVEISGARFEVWRYLRNLKTADAIRMIASRFRSVLSMTSSVFMKRIRQLQFNTLLNSDARPEKVAFNLIHSLDRQVGREWLIALDPVLELNARLGKLARDAEQVETKLWISEQQLEDLIACGRATTCFSLMKFIWTRWKEENDKGTKPPNPLTDRRSAYFEVYARLRWEWLQVNPEAGLKEAPPKIGERATGGNPIPVTATINDQEKTK